MAHISFSELKNWALCPYNHKLSYIDRIRLFQGNEYTAFGTAIHNTCEKLVSLKDPKDLDAKNYFTLEFLKELETLKEKGISLRADMVNSMREQGLMLVDQIIPALYDYFGTFELISAEEQLLVPISEFSLQEYNFKGYIDLVLKTPDGKYHVIDWKTCSWGWDMRKKADPILNYQLTLYKRFFGQKHNIELKDIETHFALLKRTAKKDNIEIFRVTSGPKKMKNALNLMTKALYNITKQNYLKNRLSCKQCDFYQTQYCN